MVLGMAAGFFLRSQSRLFPILDGFTLWVIRFLLFFLGIDIGSDGELLAQIPLLGVKGLVLAASSIIGSVAAARVMVGKFSVAGGAEESNGEESGRSGNGLDGGAADGDFAEGVAAGAVHEAERVQEVPRGKWKVLGGSLAAAGAFGLGIAVGIFTPGFGDHPFNPVTWILYLLMFLVGSAAGADPTIAATVRRHGVRMALLPLAVVVGTFLGCLGTALLWPGLPVRESLAVGAGFGYYSLSSVVIKELAGGDWAAVALLSNIFREILTLLAAPLLAFLGGPAGPAAAGGATSMDTTLAVTVQCSGRAWAVPALFSGVVLTILVPFAVSFILTV